MNRQSPRTHEVNKYDRVRKMTAAHINQKLDLEIDRHVRDACMRGPDAIRTRLHDLNTEWDMDRIVMAGLSVLLFTEVMLGRKRPKWLRPIMVQAPFLFAYATLGWAPPVPLLRRLGVRTRFEIQAEREALLDQLSKWQEPVF